MRLSNEVQHVVRTRIWVFRVTFLDPRSESEMRLGEASDSYKRLFAAFRWHPFVPYIL